jgi:transcriptional regulator with XRE-family HTH domain
VEIGAKIAFFRSKMGLTQKKLSKQIGVSIPTLARWERNVFQPRASDITKLCAVLHTTEAELLNGPQNEGYTVTLEFVRTGSALKFRTDIEAVVD